VKLVNYSGAGMKVTGIFCIQAALNGMAGYF